MLESQEFARLRVKLFKTGKFSQDEITKIFETLSSPEDLHNMSLIVKKCEEFAMLPQYAKYRGLVDEMCKFMIANEDSEPHQIVATKGKKGWGFIVK